MSHVTLTTPIWGKIVTRRLTPYFTWSTRIQNLKSLALAVPKIFQGCHILKCHMTPTTPLSEKIYHQQAETCCGQPIITFEVSIYTRYEDMKCCVKNRKLDDLGWLGGQGHSRSSEMWPFNRAHMISYSTLIESTCLSSYLLKVADFNLPHPHLASPIAKPQLNFATSYQP